MAGLLEYTKNGQVTEPPLYRFMRGNVQSFLNSIPDPSKMTPEQQLAMGLNANPIMGLLGTTAFHGSPHTFNKFDISKLGTGEGAQAFGHGMYFAENPEVAKSYIPRDFKSEDKLSKLYDQAEKKGQYAAMQIYEDLMLHKMPNEISLEGFVGNELSQAQNALKQGTKIYQSQKGANLYKVDIPDEYMPSLLQWDKPLSQQPTKVKQALEKIDPDTYSPKGIDYSPEELGQSIYLRIANSPQAQGHQQASSLLDSLGVKGIKYLDEGSRTSQAGTNNFVIFDPSQVKILERNNKGLLK
jgi:hypothetical protein